MNVNVLDAAGLSFSCKPGCGYCCTASPLVAPHEAPPLGPLVQRAEDGTLRIPLRAGACGALRADRGCGVYAERPAVCHLYPYQVHAGRRVQVTVTRACPGVEPLHPTDPDTQGTPRHPFGVDHLAEEGARRAADLALAQPGADEMATRARSTFAEFDRRMKEWGVAATPDQLRAGFLPHLERLASPFVLPAFFAGLGEGDLVLGRDPARAVGALFDAEPEQDLDELLAQAAREGLDEPDVAQWVEPDLSWTIPRAVAGGVHLTRVTPEGRDERVHALDALPLQASEAAAALVADHLRRLCHRDQTEGAAAWLVDASGYQVTPAAAYGRVLAEASLQIALRAGLLASASGLDEVDAAHARRGIAAYETAYHSLPTLGSIL